MASLFPEFQPLTRTAIESLEMGAKAADWHGLLVAAAYATEAGATVFAGSLAGSWSQFEDAKKIFVVGLDYGLTEPEALEYLCDMKGAECRVFELERTLASRLRPKVQAYHPKVFAFFDRPGPNLSKRAGGIIGSVNLTARALTENLESYVHFDIRRSDKGGAEWFSRFKRFQSDLIRSSSLVTSEVISRYRKVRPSRPPIAPARETLQPTLPSSDLDESTLLALRGARYLWTQTLTIVRNRGRGNHGNQVDLKRGARVFFDPSARLNVQKNQPLGDFIIELDGHVGPPCSMRFGDNGMDKMNLPLPETKSSQDGYEHADLVWERIGPKRFRLIVSRNSKRWRKAAEKAGNVRDYANSNRKWGFFNEA